MERVILHMKDRNCDENIINMEIKIMQKILPFLESYDTFKACNDIFDIRDHKFIRRSNKIENVFKEGLDCITKYYVFCRN